MTGVDILAMEKVATVFGFSWDIFYIVFAIVTVLVTLSVGFSTYVDIGGWSFLMGLIGGMIMGVVFGVISASEQAPPEYETQYKVTISDEVSMIDFLERYEIIEQEGKIFTVRERVDDNDGE